MERKELHFDIRHCLECGKTLKGRVGKKYCDAGCKSAFHNRNKSFGEITISQTNQIIRHNRAILKTLSPQGKATVRKEVLEQMRYDFRYFSGIYKTSTNVYYLVYDYAFAPIFEKDVEKALIVQKQDYMDQLSLQIWKK